MTLLKPTGRYVDAPGRYIRRFGWPEVGSEGPPVAPLVVDAPFQQIPHTNGGGIHIALSK